MCTNSSRKINGVCGLSGSGKTSLVKETLYPLLHEKIYKVIPDNYAPKAKGIYPKNLIDKIKSIQLIDQSPIARNRRSNLATYLGMGDSIRNLFSKTPEAIKQELRPGSFSFNSPGGRCDSCSGLGFVTEDLSFLGLVETTCRVCLGKRFSNDILKIKYQNHSISDILNLTIKDAAKVFYDHKKIRQIATTVSDLGLDYMTLGQSLSSFSGGEAQRLKLLSLLTKIDEQQKSILIFDEPSSGLSDKDIYNLTTHFKKTIYSRPYHNYSRASLRNTAFM